MELVDIKLQIKTGKFDRFYLFACEDLEVAKIYIDKIAEKTGYTLVYIDSVSEVYSKLKTKSLFSEPYIYVVMNDKEFINSKYEARWNNIETSIKGDILILQYTDVDKRIKFWKHFQNRVVFFEKLDSRILKKHIQKKLNLSDKNCEELIEICEQDYGRIKLEIDKIDHLARSCNESHDKCFRILLEDGTLYRPPKDAIFDFAATVLDRNAGLAYILLQDCYGVGEPNMVMLSVLYNNFRNLAQVQDCNQSSISKSTGLSGFQIKLVKPYVGRYSDEELVDILRLLNDVQKGIKTGGIAEEISTQYALAYIL